MRQLRIHVLAPVAALLVGCSSGTRPVDPSSGDAAVDASSGAASGSSPTPQDGGGGEGGAASGGGGGAPKGLAAYCSLYIACNGSYFADEADCIKRTADWYAICADSAAALDAYGACMVAKVTCATWNPNADQPGSKACGDEWSQLQTARGNCK